MPTGDIKEQERKEPSQRSDGQSTPEGEFSPVPVPVLDISSINDNALGAVTMSLNLINQCCGRLGDIAAQGVEQELLRNVISILTQAGHNIEREIQSSQNEAVQPSEVELSPRPESPWNTINIPRGPSLFTSSSVDSAQGNEAVNSAHESNDLSRRLFSS